MGGRWMPIQTMTPIAHDEGPQRENHAPIDEPADAGTALAASALAARRGFWPGGRIVPAATAGVAACRRWSPAAVLRAQTQVEPRGVGCTLAASLSSPRHVRSPRAWSRKVVTGFRNRSCSTNHEERDPEEPAPGLDPGVVTGLRKRSCAPKRMVIERGLRGGYRSAGPGGRAYCAAGTRAGLVSPFAAANSAMSGRLIAACRVGVVILAPSRSVT